MSAPPVADAPALELFPAPKAEPKLRTVAQKPPTEDEVIAYFASKGAPRSEAVKFRGYYQGNGWRVGKNPMKSWHGCVATWIGNWQERGGVLREPSLSPPIHDSTVSPRTDEEIDASTAERERTYQAWRDHQAKLRAAQ